jgi:ribosomal protein S16
MKPTHKNIINKWLKLYFYNYNSYYFSPQQDEVFCKNISLYFKSSNEFIQINLVQKNHWAIKYIIKNGITPSEKVKLATVNENGYAIQYIKNPSEKFQLAAVNQDGNSIQYIIKNGITPSERVQIAAVKQNDSAVYYIENPSEKVQLAAVNKNSSAIQYIKNPSEKVQLAAVNESYESICYIKNPYPSVIELYEKLYGKKYEKR